MTHLPVHCAGFNSLEDATCTGEIERVSNRATDSTGQTSTHGDQDEICRYARFDLGINVIKTSCSYDHYFVANTFTYHFSRM